MSADIKDRKDIEILVYQFYERLLHNTKIGFFFTEVEKISLDKHLPIICDFWEGILFQKDTYKRNTMLKHIELSRKHRIEESHFEEWLRLWEKTVAENHKGPLADLAKKRANEIGELMKYKILSDAK